MIFHAIDASLRFFILLPLGFFVLLQAAAGTAADVPGKAPENEVDNGNHLEDATKTQDHMGTENCTDQVACPKHRFLCPG